MDMPVAVAATRYNAVLDHPTARAAIRHFARKDARFNSTILIEQLAQLGEFPAISVGDLLTAGRAAGLHLTGAYADTAELDSINTPFLAYLKRAEMPGSLVDLVQIEEVKRRTVVLSRDRFGVQTIRRDELTKRWSGAVLLLLADNETSPTTSELDAYRAKISVFPGMLTRGECSELISYCEDACFRRSRVIHRTNVTVADVVRTQARSSSSVVLENRQHPILARLYAQCAELEGVEESNIEHIQCVRYKRHQKFRAHFDGGVELPRLTTYLLYLNDDFEGGETYFPMLDHAVAPRPGSCLRFPSCDREGRILWPSEHGGLPVTNGIKYALNIWVRCPERSAAP